MQSATAFATSFPFIFGDDEKKVAKIPCLIPCGIDQDPYFRQCRDQAEKMKYVKPALIHAGFLPSLKGSETKMSASDPDSSITFADTDKQIQKKVASSFSGGQDTRELHRQLGGRTDVDIPFQYLRFFLDDDAELERIRAAYEAGTMETGELKQICTRELQAYVSAFRERRRAVTVEVRDEFLRPRPLEFKGSPFATRADLEGWVARRKVAVEAEIRGMEAWVATMEPA
jgi:tryptophanyl-tRNA synthetase